MQRLGVMSGCSCTEYQQLEVVTKMGTQISIVLSCGIECTVSRRLTPIFRT